MRSNLINHFVFTELDRRIETFKWLDRETFINAPLADKDRWITALKAYIKEEGIPLELKDETLAAITIQSYLGLQLFDEAVQLQILHRQDEFVLKVLEEIKKKTLD